MIRTIGFRAAPQLVYFSVLEIKDEQISVVSNDTVILPIALSLPEKLQYLRNTVIDIIEEFQVKNAGIRLSEPTTKVKNTLRLNIEGVLQEMISSCCIENYYTGQISKLSGLLHTDRKNIKEWIEGSSTPSFTISNWDKFSKEEREAILTSLAAGELK